MGNNRKSRKADIELCATCKSFSRTGTKKGYCLKTKNSTDINNYCGNYKPDGIVEYEIECKLYRR